jgi:hypothetical protein
LPSLVHTNTLTPVTKGRIYCNTIKYFTEIEDNKVRGDIDENCGWIDYLGDSTLSMKPVDTPNAEPLVFQASGTRIKQHFDASGYNLFCMYLLVVDSSFPNGFEPFNDRCKEFGSHLLLVKDSPEFMKRIEAKLAALGYGYERTIVSYSDLSQYSGGKSYFMKDSSYSYQNEYRFIIKSNKDEPLILDIGSIEDIAVMIHANDNLVAVEE